MNPCRNGAAAKRSLQKNQLQKKLGETRVNKTNDNKITQGKVCEDSTGQQQREERKAWEEKWRMMVILTCIFQITRTRDNEEPSQPVSEKHPPTMATSAHREKQPYVTSHPAQPPTTPPHPTYLRLRETKPVAPVGTDQGTRDTPGGETGATQAHRENTNE